MHKAKEANDLEMMIAAVRLNWQLWTIIQSELLAPDCPVPTEIRENVLSLSNFIDKHTINFIADPESGKLEILVSINRELASGLYEMPEQDAEAPDGADESAPSEPTSVEESV